jgi:hypothetical protein
VPHPGQGALWRVWIHGRESLCQGKVITYSIFASSVILTSPFSRWKILEKKLKIT